MSFEVCEPLFSGIQQASQKKVVLQGGTSSAKTYTALQVILLRAAKESYTITTVVGQDVPNLKKGAIRDAAKIMSTSTFLQAQVYDYKNTKGYNKTERIYEFKNGSIVEFNSYDNEQDAKSGKRDYLFINEANGISYEIYFQLSIRTRTQEILDYNPSARFWVHDKLVGREEVILLITDHRHNPFLSKSQHAEIEGIEDEELWKVYARGMTGMIHGLIYTHFKVIDDMPLTFPSVLGLDFGYNHQTALIDVAYDSGRLFWDQLIYEGGLTIGDLIMRMRELNLGKKKIYADHAAPDKIEDLKRAGFNVYKADKDVKNGIDFVKRNQLYITRRSSGLRSEALTYKYKTKDGIMLDEPVKFKDDGMDGGRYGSYTGFRKPKDMVIADEPGMIDLLDTLE